MTSQQHVTAITSAREDISGMGELRDVPAAFGSPFRSHSELQEKGNGEIVERDDQRKDVSSSLGTQTHMNVDQELVITTIRAMNVAIGLTHLPAGFYTAVRHSGLEWRTANKPVSVKNDVVEWDEPIPVPSDLSVMLHLEVYASFEFRPMLGQGKALRKLSVTLQQLLDLSDKGLPFGDPASSSLALLVIVGRNSSTSRALGLYRSITDKLDPLEEVTDEGHSAFSRYQKNGTMSDLNCSIEAFQRALDNCSSEHPCRAAAQSNLAMAKLASCEVDHSNHSFDDPIALYRDALSARPAGHPDRPSTLINLAIVYLFRFERQRDAIEVTQAEALLREAMDLSGADSHEEQAVILARRRLVERTTGDSSSTGSISASRFTDDSTSSVDVQLLLCFERSGDLATLEEAISVLEVSISASVRDPTSLGNLGVALWYRFTRLGQLNDLEQAIEMQRNAVDFTPDGPIKSSRLNNLGNSLLSRFQNLGDLVDLAEAIGRHRDAIDIIPDSHPDKPRHLNNLGNCFLARFERLGKLDDLEQAITMHKDAVGCIPDSHPDEPNHLNNLATCFRTRFRHLHELCDLDEAVSHHQKAVQLTPDENSSKSVYLSNLATSVLIRFMQAGEFSDLIQAIARHQQALQLTPDGHPDKPRLLNNLANSFLAHFECLGNPNDLEEVILGHAKAIELTPDGHPDKPRRVNNLANSFRTRFQCLGELKNLEQAISGHQKAMELAGQNGDSHVYLHSLATSFLTRFKHLGNPSDLEEAMTWYNKATEITPNGHRRKPVYLNDLGMALLTRFEWLGNLDDLKDGVSWIREAVALTADRLLEKAHYLRNLGICLRTRFTHVGQLEDLDQAISVHNKAVRRIPGGSRDNSNCWDYRANVSTTDARFGYPRSERSDLEQAILSYEEAVRLTSDHNPNKWRRLNNLANCFLARFEQLGDPVDLRKATKLHEDAVRLKLPSSSSRTSLPCDPSLLEGCDHHSPDVHQLSCTMRGPSEHVDEDGRQG